MQKVVIPFSESSSTSGKMYSKSLRCVSGTVSEFLNPYKVLVSFHLNGKNERALLMKEKFIVNGRSLANDTNCKFEDFIGINSQVEFVAHVFYTSSSKESDKFNWFIILAWSVEEISRLSVNYIPGIVNAPCRVISILNRQGVMTYEFNGEETGGVKREFKILFLASKVYLFGHRLNSKSNMCNEIALDDLLCCDAMPCDPDQNNAGCSWFATCVWKGPKPSNTVAEPDKTPVAKSLGSLLSQYRSLTNNSRKMFVSGSGQVMSVMNQDFGLALLQLRSTQWQSVLFHRSICFVKGINLSNHDLTQILKEGDYIHMIVLATPYKFPYKWVACQVTVAVDGPKDPRIDPHSGIEAIDM